jgi:hypothetical protein
MECPKCGHRILNRDDKCLYCGAWIEGNAPSNPRTEASQSVTSSLPKTGKDSQGIQVTREEIILKKLEELPESLRAKIVEMLQKGEGQNTEIKSFFCNFSESLDRTRPKKKKMSFLSALKILLKKE